MNDVLTAAIPQATAVASNGRLYSTGWSCLLAHDNAGQVWLYRSGISGAFFTVCLENGKPMIDPCSTATAYRMYDDLAVKDAPFAALVYAGTFA